MGTHRNKKGGIRISKAAEKKFKNKGCDDSTKVCPYSQGEDKEIPKEIIDNAVADNKRMINSDIARELKSLKIFNDSDLNKFLSKNSKPKEKLILPHTFDDEGNLVVVGLKKSEGVD